MTTVAVLVLVTAVIIGIAVATLVAIRAADRRWARRVREEQRPW
ncbi:hypothetical protein [Pseudonocardia lacus]|jgi:hypothetical protein|nr:hypothetical protein [Pseudonocardia lacus]